MSYRKNIHNLSASIRPYRGEMSLAIIMSLVKQFSVIAVAALTSYLVGMCMAHQMPRSISWYLAGIMALVLLRALAGWCEMYFAHDVAFRVIRNYRSDLFRKISAIAPAYTLRRKTGELGQSLVSDVEVLELFLAHTFSGFLVAAIMTGMIFIILLFVHPVFSLLLLTASLLLAVIPYKMKRQAEEQGSLVRRRLADSNASMVEFIQGLRELITLDQEQSFKRRMISEMDSLYDAQKIYGFRKGKEAMAMQLISGGYTVTVMLFAAGMVSRGQMDFALYPVTVMLSTILLSPVMELSAVVQEMGVVFAAANRIQDILHTEPAVLDEGQKICRRSGCRVEFCSVSFHYEKDTEDVLNQVSFAIEPGEKVVLVGKSGAGKSTCANLLLRYWDLSAGNILIDGVNLKSYTMDSLRETISAVQQDSYLFHTSIKENIRMGKPEAADTEIEQAAKEANIHEFICSLPQGYHTITGERGIQLSGGQKQRIAIARTLLRDTPIVIFDEAVSNLDTENELYIQKTLKTMMHDKTVLMIAHRLSTILSADKIVLLGGGKVMAQGTHEELMQHSPYYRKLIECQLY